MCIRDSHYSVRDNGVIRKLAAYVILGINAEGKKEVLTISIGENSWPHVLVTENGGASFAEIELPWDTVSEEVKMCIRDRIGGAADE